MAADFYGLFVRVIPIVVTVETDVAFLTKGKIKISVCFLFRQSIA